MCAGSSDPFGTRMVPGAPGATGASAGAELATLLSDVKDSSRIFHRFDSSQRRLVRHVGSYFTESSVEKKGL